jgi:hypothetical protein
MSCPMEGEGDSEEERLWPVPTDSGVVTMVSEVSC